MFAAIAISLVAGALATSFAEYHFSYNLVDYIVEGVKKLLGFATKAEAKAIADAKAIEAAGKDVAKKL
jgi:hypothetical protein